MKDLDNNGHSVFLMYYHLILVVKYRRKVIDDAISGRGREIFVYIAENYGITLEEWNHDVDHVHIMFRAQPKTELSRFINAYKSASSRLLKKEYPGRTLMRAIAFLPVIIGSGVLMDILKNDVFATGVANSSETVVIFSSAGMSGFFSSMGLPETIVNLINQLISKIFDLTWRSGVQILLFLAGLHNIPDYVYEAAEIEGANALQVFFKITLPMLTPMILLNIVYSVIDIFSDFGNTIIQMIYNTAFSSVRFGYSSALSILYFIMVGVVLVLVYLMMNKIIVRPEN